MPILTQPASRSQRRLPVWALLLALVVLPLVGVFGWSCYQPVGLTLGMHEVGFGYGRKAYASSLFKYGLMFSGSDSETWPKDGDVGRAEIPALLKPGFYYVWWY